jgi:hypothetical protein
MTLSSMTGHWAAQAIAVKPCDRSKANWSVSACRFIGFSLDSRMLLSLYASAFGTPTLMQMRGFGD